MVLIVIAVGPNGNYGWPEPRELWFKGYTSISPTKFQTSNSIIEDFAIPSHADMNFKFSAISGNFKSEISNFIVRSLKSITGF